MKRRPPRSTTRPTTGELLARIATLEQRLRAATRALARKNTEARALTHDLAEALEQQTATNEILRVISTSPTETRPVFETIVENARRLLGGHSAALVRLVGDEMHLDALSSTTDAGDEALRDFYPMRLSDAPLLADAFRRNEPLIFEDTETDPRIRQRAREIARARGYRSVVQLPLLHDGAPIGSINVSRREPGPFTENEMTLLQTFADQAVIAIENVRLFTELQEKNRALTDAHARMTDALNRQTATSDILRVISSSPTDTRPVFDAIARDAMQLLAGHSVSVTRVLGDEVHLMAFNTVSPESDAVLRAGYPVRLDQWPAAQRTVREGTPTIVEDVETDADATDRMRRVARARGFRSFVWMPMLHDGAAVGWISVTRAQPGPFSDDQIELLRTFADQAVIAIENVRLFTELEARNRELTEALATQTATGEILRVISRSGTDVQPVFDAIAESALRLLRGWGAMVVRFDGELLHAAAIRGGMPGSADVLRERFPMPLQRGQFVADVILDREVKQIADAESDDVPPAPRANARLRGWRANLGVPMLHDGQPIGVITVTRAVPGAYSSQDVELLKTFADQAVIAVENARLLAELQARTAELTRSVDELTALGDVGRALNSTLDLETVLQTIVTRAVQIAGTAGCTIWEYDGAREEFHLRASHYADEADAARLQAPGRVTTIPRGLGVTTQVMERRQPVQIVDIATDAMYESPIRRPLVEAGHRALLGVPLLSEDEVVGVLAVTRKTPGEFAPEIVRLLSTFGTQSALAIQNARLFLEIEDKSQQLEVASRHKSEFLANMSHELRTPLNAIIGFSEVLAEGMFGDINDKQAEYLRDILESGRHLLSLINDILDLSKIEAGRMELEATDFDLPAAIDNALTLVRERAGRRGIALGRAIDPRVGTIRGDERKVKQVLLNLLSNALKFTSEGGRIDVRAEVDDGMVEIAVADTGVGIAPEDQETLFEEFRQVGAASKKVEGTGLGLALSRKFIELHGGRIWLRSEVGVGSTFTFTLPRPKTT